MGNATNTNRANPEQEQEQEQEMGWVAWAATARSQRGQQTTYSAVGSALQVVCTVILTSTPSNGGALSR